MKQRGITFIGIVLMTVYYFLFPRHTGQEPVLKPVSFTDLAAGSTVEMSGGEALIPVHVRNRAAYFDENFHLVSSRQAPGLSAERDWMAVPEPDSVSVFDVQGRLRFRIKSTAMPVVRDGHLYLLDNSSGRIEMCSPENGAGIWHRDSLSPLTSLDSAAGRTLLGFLDGHAELISPDGKVEMTYRPGGSRVEAVYGAALSDDAAAIALISGLDPQRFILLEEKKNGFRPVTHHETGTDFRRSVPVGFVSGGNRILYEAAEGTAAVERDGYSLQHLTVAGTAAAQWDFSSESGYLALLGGDAEELSLRILTPRDFTFCNSRVLPDTRDILFHKNYLILAGDRYFSVIALEKH